MEFTITEGQEDRTVWGVFFGSLVSALPILTQLPFQTNEYLPSSSVVGVGAVRIYYGFKATNTADITCKHIDSLIPFSSISQYVKPIRISPASNGIHLTCSIGVNANIMLWTAVECCIGTICASLPAMAPLLKRSHNNPGRMGTIWSRLVVSNIPKPWSPFRRRWSLARDGSSDEGGSSLRNLRPTGDASGTCAKEVV